MTPRRLLGDVRPEYRSDPKYFFTPTGDSYVCTDDSQESANWQAHSGRAGWLSPPLRGLRDVLQREAQDGLSYVSQFMEGAATEPQ